MPFMKRLRGLLGSEPRTFEYVCMNCDAEFESQKSDMSSVSCPECGATRIRAGSMADTPA
jgi:DNA-directed RNA polymerase subunit RPC12/RpoP